jgi:hypothetical protein
VQFVFAFKKKAVPTRKTKESVEGMLVLSLRPILSLSRESLSQSAEGYPPNSILSTSSHAM